MSQTPTKQKKATPKTDAMEDETITEQELDLDSFYHMRNIQTFLLPHKVAGGCEFGVFTITESLLSVLADQNASSVRVFCSHCGSESEVVFDAEGVVEDDY